MMKGQDIRILLVDDEPQLLSLVQEILLAEGFCHVDTAADAATADRLYRGGNYQLVLLDIMLPDQDGFTLYESWRRAGYDAPVIFLSARDADVDRLHGLRLGADDYITKPFLPQELVLRVRAILRRCGALRQDEIIRIGTCRVDLAAGTILRDDNELPLTAKEYALLSKLYEERGRIVSMNALMDTLWPDGSYGYENSLMVHVRRLRAKLEEDPSNPRHLLTVRGLGYKLVV